MRRRQRRGGGKQLQGEISGIGGRGDGLLAPQPGMDGPVFVPLTVPGDEVRVQTTSRSASGTQSEILELLREGPDRVEPPCPHFGACGGCQLQHWKPKAQQDWKLARVEEAVSRAGFDPALVLPLESVGPATRRRAEFVAVQPAGKPVQIGFRRRSSHWVEVIETCMVLRPTLVEALPLLREALDGLIEDRDGLRLHITEADNGLDIALSGGLKPGFETQDRLARTAETAGWARLTHDELPVAVREQPRLGLGKASVPLPQRAFLQPSEDGQTILQSLVLAAIPDEVGLVLDLFSGHGTFALPLAERGHRVGAYEGAAPAIAALEAAARDAGFSGLTATTRDLNAWPVSGPSLREAGAVVIDPPRPGAKAQCEALAQDGPGTVVAVSCNPSTFARDARILRDGGYGLEWVAPLDQFLFTGHVELVARFFR
ncbi:MAG: 23S rRNA (uracil(1939)-C(5))-methyltransferase RlmD [Rhodospirillaceae bacterium]|nr:MAG: 23S rRNA (uracil(1939)-C(5))-methyltransferase RlmD [Rhodospirillaceae bacterium]